MKLPVQVMLPGVFPFSKLIYLSRNNCWGHKASMTCTVTTVLPFHFPSSFRRNGEICVYPLSVCVSVHMLQQDCVETEMLTCHYNIYILVHLGFLILVHGIPNVLVALALIYKTQLLIIAIISIDFYLFKKKLLTPSWWWRIPYITGNYIFHKQDCWQVCLWQQKILVPQCPMVKVMAKLRHQQLSIFDHM